MAHITANVNTNVTAGKTVRLPRPAWRLTALPLAVALATAPACPHAMSSSLTPVPASANDAPGLDERVNQLASELRCLVCQNQTIAESTAPLARQLKAEVRAQLAGGASEQQVRDFLAQRYGDFVLYRPPVTRLTWLLWGGPLGLLVLGGLLMCQRRANPSPANTPPELDKDLDDSD